MGIWNKQWFLSRVKKTDSNKRNGCRMEAAIVLWAGFCYNDFAFNNVKGVQI